MSAIRDRLSIADLLKDFPAVATEEWERQIREELAGRDYGETLLWHLPEGITVRPYYRAEDLRGIAHLEAEVTHPMAVISSGWRIGQEIVAQDAASLDEALGHAVSGGAEVLVLPVHDGGDGGGGGLRIRSATDLDDLVKKTSFPEVTTIYRFEGDALSLLKFMTERITSSGRDRPAVAIDPISRAVRFGGLGGSDFDAAAELIRISGPMVSGFGPLMVDSQAFHMAGATAVQEIALTMAACSEYLDRLIERGLSTEQVLSHTGLAVQVGTSYFLEIAKLRAVRLLLPQIASAYNPEASNVRVPVHARTSLRSQTLYDPYSNLLRATTEAASAIIGGADVVFIRPHDPPDGVRPATPFALRLARNVQLLLRHEAHFDGASDSAAGSYYLEALTDGLARRAWNLFTDIENAGGLIRSLEEGRLQPLLRASREERQASFGRGDSVLVGTNLHPSPDELRGANGAPFESDSQASVESIEQSDSTFGALFEPLPAARDAEPFERLRLATEEAIRLGTRRPQVSIVHFGSSAEGSARARFAGSFFAAAGYEIAALMNAPSATDGLRRSADAQVVVLCSSDPDYGVFDLEAISRWKAEWGGEMLLLVTSDDNFLQEPIDMLIDRGADQLRILARVHERLGILQANH